MGKKLNMFILYVKLIMDLAIDFFYSLYWDKRKEAIPDLEQKHEILTESATALAKKIKNKELKSEDLVRTLIERIKQVNPIINAIAAERYEAALNKAREVDALIANGLDEDAQKKPFLGVPLTTKESQAVKGLPLTMGLWSRRKEVATEDSEAIVRLKNAGAIVVAATNLPELLVWQETRNPVYGMTRNPHHTGRSPGGSSGAEAALTATYATTISLCSDIGGSTRMPAFYCGMFGHHPTPGTTNFRGVFFRKGDEESMLALGFISKHTEDLIPLTKIIAGDKAQLLKLDRSVDMKDIKFYYLESSKDVMVSSVRSEIKKAMQRVVSKITEDVSSSSNVPQPYYHEGFNYMYILWKYWMSKEPDNTAQLYTNNNGEANGIIELVKKLFGLSSHYIFSIFRLIEEQYLPKVNSAWAEKVTADLKQDLFSKLGDNGVLLMPSAPQVAPYHYSSLLRPFNFSYFAIVNTLMCPATQVPLGKNSEGLPLGIQVVAAPHNDALCLTVAKYLEKQFGGAVMACELKK
ncbi:fatty-acid amide hydrolase 2 [Manduca sexta]|nr:fatty-acid amide hydrolase 2 [Manduca sexta]